MGEASRTDLPPYMERRIGESIMRDIRLREPPTSTKLEVAALPQYVGCPPVRGHARGGPVLRVLRLARRHAQCLVARPAAISAAQGLILAAQSESELAGVFSHEIAHVTQKHPARLMGKQNQAQMTQWLAIAVAILAARSNSDISQAAIATAPLPGADHAQLFARFRA
ncbi:MAG: M48 family metalloprotease [Rhodocyclaceae bacterium]|nr:M48 family metalloprotease [Rhodocyclaceae bacterium]